MSPLPLLAGAIAINLLDVFLYVASDAQKHSVLKLQPGLIWDGCWPLPQHQLSGRSADLPLLRHHGYALAAQSPGHYAAFAQFNDLRSGQPRQRSFALALRIPTSPGAGVRHDARMAAEVTEIERRVFAEEWG